MTGSTQNAASGYLTGSHQYSIGNNNSAFGWQALIQQLDGHSEHSLGVVGPGI